MEKRIYGEQPFWFWNGTMDANEVRRQIFAMKEGGARGFFLHPRQGMDLPYMSDRFIEMVGVAVKAAAEAGMDMWLYDEYPYPSGVGGGELLIEPGYVARTLTPIVFDGEGLIKQELRWGKVLYAKAFPVKDDGSADWNGAVDVQSKIGITYLREIYQGGTGLSVYNRKRFFTGAHSKQLYWQAPAGRWRVFAFIEHEMEDFKYFGGFVDPVNPAAMQAYIRHTHERYYKAFGEYFGTTIKGIFTDETAPNSERGILWSNLMPELFYKRNGYDLIGRLPALLAKTDGDDEKFLYDFHNTIIEAFIDSFDKPLRKWCDERGIAFTGEKPHYRLNQVAHMKLPGTDNGHVKVGAAPTVHPGYYRASAKIAASSAHFEGDNSALCEAYHSTGWDMTMRDMRWMVDWLGVQGINLFVPHAFYYSDDALRKHDAPPSAFESMPWWRYNTLYASHLDNTTRVTLHGKRYAPVLVADPAINAWTSLAEIRNQRNPDTRLTRVQKALAARHIDYYIVDTDILSRASFEGGKIVIGGEAFEALVLPGMRIVEQGNVDALEKAAAAGAKLYVSEEAPARNITTGRPWALAAGSYVFAQSAGDLADILAGDVTRVYGVTTNGSPNANILAAAFEMDGAHYIYTVNLCREPQSCEIWFKAGTDSPVAQVDTVTGKAVARKHAFAEGAVVFTKKYAPFEGALLCVGISGEKEPAAQTEVDLSLSKRRGLTLHNHNLLRLGKWRADLGGNKCVVDSMPVIDQLVDAGAKIVAAENSGFGCVKKLVFSPMKLVYEADFGYDAQGTLLFAMEPGSVNGAHRIYLNETDITGMLERTFVYKRGNLACDIAPYARKGMNTLRVEVEATIDHDGVVNPLYIAGEFSAVKTEGVWWLGKTPAQGAIGDRVGGGLPFFSGVADYDITEEIRAAQGTQAQITISNWLFEDAAELIINGESAGSLAWDPYRWNVSLPQNVESAVLRVANTMLPAFEGAHFDLEAHQTVFVD